MFGVIYTVSGGLTGFKFDIKIYLNLISKIVQNLISK